MIVKVKIASECDRKVIQTTAVFGAVTFSVQSLVRSMLHFTQLSSRDTLKAVRHEKQGRYF